eukprot:1143326-Pelagomonas_calceolata.AAC.4
MNSVSAGTPGQTIGLGECSRERGLHERSHKSSQECLQRSDLPIICMPSADPFLNSFVNLAGGSFLLAPRIPGP